MAAWAIRSTESYPRKPLSEPRITSPSFQQKVILATLVHRAKALCDKESLRDELEFLTTTFREKGTVLRRYDVSST